MSIKYVNETIINCLSKPITNWQLETISTIISQIDKKFPSTKNLVINTVWLDFVKIEKIIDELENSDETYKNIFLISLIDQVNVPNEILELYKQATIFQIGDISDDIYNSKKIHIPFSPILIKNNFKNYSEEDLLLSENSLKNKFLCYQNKPHKHRQYLTSKLIDTNLIDNGIVTLCLKNNDQIFYDNVKKLDTDNSGVTFFGDAREDPYSLGNLEIWRSHFLNIVSETLMDSKYFITEKTYKPIVGLRPFVLYGNPNLLKFLKNNGFYTFEDYWQTDFNKAINNEEILNCIIDVVRQVCSTDNKNLMSMYNEMIPKLIHNRNRFFEHAAEQEKKLNNLF